MKIYPVIKKCSTGINVGVLLVNNNEICFESNFRVTSDLESEGYLMGINRALSAIKNRQRNITHEDVVCILPKEFEGWINLRIREDRYIQHLKRILNISIVTKEIAPEDTNFSKLAEQKCNLLKVVNDKER